MASVSLADKACDCKGIRTCLMCESAKGSKLGAYYENPKVFYSVCSNCGAAKKHSDYPAHIDLYCKCS